MSNAKSTKSKHTEKSPFDGLLKLPFVSSINNKPCYWDVKPTGDYEVDCKTGTQYATQTLDFILETNFNPFLGWIV
jgi:hypothetical protein